MTISASTVSGEIIAYNAGTFETAPVLVIDGPVNAPQIFAQLPGGGVALFSYSQNLDTGEQLVIDADAHTVILNGNVSRRRFLNVSTGWPKIPAEAVVSFQFRSLSYNANALLTVRWRSAWM